MTVRLLSQHSWAVETERERKKRGGLLLCLPLQLWTEHHFSINDICWAFLHSCRHCMCVLFPSDTCIAETEPSWTVNPFTANPLKVEVLYVVRVMKRSQVVWGKKDLKNPRSTGVSMATQPSLAKRTKGLDADAVPPPQRLFDFSYRKTDTHKSTRLFFSVYYYIVSWNVCSHSVALLGNQLDLILALP